MLKCNERVRLWLVYLSRNASAANISGTPNIDDPTLHTSFEDNFPFIFEAGGIYVKYSNIQPTFQASS